MAGSQVGIKGRNPHIPSPITPGPRGDKDAASPEMCLQRDPLGSYFSLLRLNRDLECKKVKEELAVAHKMRDAFVDVELLQEAKKMDWSANEYQQKVAEKVFGRPKPGDKGATYENPMYTDPTTCRIIENWDIAMYRKKGLPDIIYQADKAHEQVHRKSCLDRGIGNAMQYNADMSFPSKLSEEEIRAYSKKIDVLEKWARENCPYKLVSR
jgi:hypothetical protein